MTWWQPVFFILLVPLVVVELVVFIKTKRLHWLFYALSIFTYVVFVTYTLDVFDASRNVIILTLLASAGAMALIGRHLGKSVKKTKWVSRSMLTSAIVIFAILAIVFAISAIFGKTEVTVSPMESVAAADVLRVWDDKRVAGSEEVKLLTIRAENGFFLPVPVERREYYACLHSAEGSIIDMSQTYRESPEEVPGGSAIDIPVLFYRAGITPQEVFTPVEVRVYATSSMGPYLGCSEREDPLYTIPVR